MISANPPTSLFFRFSPHTLLATFYLTMHIRDSKKQELLVAKRDNNGNDDVLHILPIN